MASHSSTTTAYSRSYAQANPIDLTLDDEDEDIHTTERMTKRQCNHTRTFNANCQPSGSNLSRQQSSSGLSPAMSLSTLAPHTAPSTPSGSQTPQSSQSSSSYHHTYDAPVSNTVRPPLFKGPSTSAAFFQPQPHAAPSSNPLGQVPPPYSQAPGRPSSEVAARQVIDLTDSPSPPPPRSSQSQPQPPHPHSQQLHPSLGNLPMDLPPKTPVCIGVLPATALVLYPIPYLIPQDPNSMDAEWAPVRLQYEHLENKPNGASETINVRPPSRKAPTGEIIPGETFAVVEQKVATPLGPMLGKGLIRLDAKIRKVNRTVSPHTFCAQWQLMLHRCQYCNSKY